jgi:Ca2+-binding EF-hand superfamily protein
VLSERRRQLVHLAFRILDRDGSGQVEMNDIQGVYNAQSHPDVVMGKRTEQEVRVCGGGACRRSLRGAL